MSERILGEFTKQPTVAQLEKGYSGELATIGKLAYFTEHFDGLKIEEQDIETVIPVEKPTKTSSFKSGYERGMYLVKHGFTEEHYHSFLENLRKGAKEKVEKMEISKKIGYR